MFPDPFGFDPQRPRDLVRQGDDEAAVSYINKFVEAGSVRAMIAMADYWFDKGDEETSLAWMDRAERSVADGDFVSPIYLSSAYRRGLGRGTPPERFRKALALRERVAESGNVTIISEMMSTYLYGLSGAPQDYERFIYWTEKAATLGSESAAQVLRDEGRSMPDPDPFCFDPQRPRDLVRQGDDEAAVSYINTFVEVGSVDAMIAMADYWFDKGDKETSLAWMDRVERSIADDDFVSPLFLSSAYRRGLGRGTAYERYHKAFALRERVAESGNVTVIHEMMSNYRYGLNGARQDYERFIYWTEKAAALGSEAAAQVLRLNRLPKSKSLAFALLQCERLMPALNRLAVDVTLDVSFYRTCLDAAWRALYGEKDPLTCIELAAQCFKAAPDIEDYDHPLVSAALNAALSVSEVMNFLLDQEVTHIIEVASFARETAALRDQADSSISPGSLSSWEKELMNQSEDLGFLELLSVDSPKDMVALVKGRAAGGSIDSF